MTTAAWRPSSPLSGGTAAPTLEYDVPMALDDRNVLAALDARIRTMLPEEYQDTYADVQPVPMRSAGLKFDAGRPASPGTRCGGASATWRWPAARRTRARCSVRAHRRDRGGAEALRRGPAGDLPRHPGRHRASRRVPSPVPGWVRVSCLGEGMAGWLLRAIIDGERRGPRRRARRSIFRRARASAWRRRSRTS